MARERISLRIDPVLLAAARREAEAEGIALTQLVERKLRDEREPWQDAFDDLGRRLERLEAMVRA